MSKLFPLIPTPGAMQDKASVAALKERLDWGEPALTIIDVSDRDTFNASHIMGAIAMPLEELVSRARAALETNRDIYVYGQTEEQTAAAASRLRAAGYQNIAELMGGLVAWKRSEYPIEGL
ncbi:rhodanese-like domain-containing protein [Stenomitos frigidus]|uniref:Rhodanese-like domain-containing protein n=1 Tax=Stenomitos frigidus ULC18 TaxID=2107698 RepID=A0A2T1E7J2_9CYAN|nr:rhodanese-like domain-containing protein [Stenomitos frigidus]PSB28707.1 rhodanese-like domain-containing protein [Stenomitos frigidus ULC18]